MAWAIKIRERVFGLVLAIKVSISFAAFIRRRFAHTGWWPGWGSIYWRRGVVRQVRRVIMLGVSWCVVLIGDDTVLGGGSTSGVGDGCWVEYLAIIGICYANEEESKDYPG